MGEAKSAHVRRVELLNPATQLFDLEMSPGASLSFVGGQYIIIDSGLVAPTGKAVKRAFSILSEDQQQQRFQLAVQRLPNGPGSGYMHGLSPNQSVKFSGPWGKMFPADESARASLVVATDTGITAALGLVRGRRFATSVGKTTLLWLREPGVFLPDDFVRARLPTNLHDFFSGALPPSNHPERVAHVLATVDGLLARDKVERAYAVGDGAVNYALIEALAPLGIAIDRDAVDSFFNAPKKSA